MLEHVVWQVQKWIRLFLVPALTASTVRLDMLLWVSRWSGRSGSGGRRGRRRGRSGIPRCRHDDDDDDDIDNDIDDGGSDDPLLPGYRIKVLFTPIPSSQLPVQ